MLIVAGVVFALAILLWLIDKCAENPNVSFYWAIRLLIFVSIVLMGIHSCSR